MNQSVEARAGTASQLAGRMAATRPMLTMLRREFWEHRALWIAPLVVSAGLLIAAAFGRANFPGGNVADSTQMQPGAFESLIAAGVVLGIGGVQYFVMSIVLWFYTTDCLYAERRDRSILFWKSMPVSDGATVLSKALIALVAVPLFVYAVALLTSLAAFGIWSIRGFSGATLPPFWNAGAWLRAEGFSLVWLVSAVLWYAPLTAYLLLISAWARRNVQLWAILPPLIAILTERIGFGTHYLSTWVLYRLGPGWQSQWEQWFERLFSGPYFYSSGGAGSASPQIFQGFEPLQAFANIDLWLGLIAAAALLFATTRIRRYRDDT